MAVLHKYRNGNVDVTLYDDGTKVREWEGEQIVDHPETADIKLTNRCSLGDKYDQNGTFITKSSTCAFCHEQSNNIGVHGDLDLILKIWESQPAGTEAALGGGDLFEHPGVPDFMFKMSRRGIIPNTTVNMLHMRKHSKLIQQLQQDKCMYGLGISYRGKEFLKTLPNVVDYKHVVFHMILGLTDYDDCKAVIDWCKDNKVFPKFLLLGYKQFGNGIRQYSPKIQENINMWKTSYLPKLRSLGNLTLSFDNLAIDQVSLKETMTPKQWSLFYLGEEGSMNMYVDSVTKVFAKQSTSNIRYPLADTLTTQQMLKTIHNEIKTTCP